ncbi:endoribonuclease L-PSP [Pseudomonas aeruginosa]|nr:endoribonuclease L-PSP [Pseudomonas aeruginosa]
MPIQRQHTNERMSQIVVHNGTVYLAGQVGEDMSAGVEQQTRETLRPSSVCWKRPAPTRLGSSR